ncbi:hypothetical protein M8494_19810 [Serratia ureilytica]
MTAIDLDPLLCWRWRAARWRPASDPHSAGRSGDPGLFFRALSGPAPQAAVSSTALHWLMPEQQLALAATSPGCWPTAACS